MKIEFNEKGTWFKVDEETTSYAMQYVDTATKIKGMTFIEIINDLQDKFNLDDSEMAACIFTLGIYVAQNS